MQKPYTPRCGHGKTKIDLFHNFLQKSPMSKLSVKVSTLYAKYKQWRGGMGNF
jgi:hypothetical protein